MFWARAKRPGIDALQVYTACISASGILLLGLSLARVAGAMPDILVFLVLGVAAELTTSEAIAPQIAFSVSSAVGFATVLLFGPMPAALVGTAGGLATTLVKAWVDSREHRRRETSLLRRALFNMAALGWAPAVAGLVYLAMGGTLHDVLRVANLLPVLLAAACHELANAAIVVVAVSLQTRQPALQIWRQSVSWATPMNVLGMAIGGGGLAMGYQIAGVPGAAVFFLPSVLSVYAFRLYVAQTKAQMVRCEKVIAERTAELQAANRELESEIGDRKRAEEELVLRAGLLDAATDSIFVCDATGKFTYLNEAAHRSRGYTKDELMALDLRALTVPRLRDYVAEQMQEVLEKGVVTYESVDCRRDGSPMPVEVHARTVGSNGRKVVMGVARDVTERKRLEEQLLQAQKMETVGRLAGGIAHDFNNLLTAISGYASFVQAALPPEHEAQQDIAQVLSGAESAANLIRQLLAFSRRQIIAPQALDLNDVILNLDKMLRRLIGEDIELVTLPGPDLGTVKVDPSQIEQVLINLAVNARDAMPNGGTLVIETANAAFDKEYARQEVSVTPGDYVLLTVSDTGCGMTDEVKARIFEPYFTTKEPGKGTGLGLATCYGIVKQNGGHIWFSSEAGKGTVFKIIFPRVAEPAMTRAERAEQPCKRSVAQTVLLAEDEPTVRSFAARVLRQAGYTVLEAANGPEALRLAARRNGEPIHLLVTDVVMPQMSGLELSQQLRLRHPRLKTLFISGYTEKVGAHQGTDGAVAYLQKPFSQSSLSRKVQETIEAA